ncbi:glucosaminidase domain-containing protein [Amycolatopsis sp. NPDC059657]|uniref:glucosaminidase domain-containing protein n=1 Tax=Amycolatopsis sp. NPDC059657 TaxID=3346899 RepID=UPI003670BCF6
MRTLLPLLVLVLLGGTLSTPAEAADVLVVDPATATAFIDSAGPAAQRGKADYGVPASVTVAQSILESGWGRSAVNNNYFGIKCGSSGPGPIALGCADFITLECCPVHEVLASFRTYASMEDSFRDHGLFLASRARYAKAFAYPDDPNQFIREVHAAGYATDPGYSDKVIGLMQKYGLYRFDG